MVGMTLTTKQAIELYESLLGMQAMSLPARVAFGIAKSLQTLQPTYVALQTAIAYSEDKLKRLRQYDKRLYRLAKQHNAIVEGAQFRFEDPVPPEVEALMSEFADVPELIEARERKRLEILAESEPIDYTLMEIPLSALESLELTPKQLSGITPLIFED